MATRTVTLATFRTDISARCDLPTFSTVTYVTTSEVNRLINVSIQALSAILMEAYGDDYFTQTETITANSAYTAVPTRCHKIKGLWWVRATNDSLPIERAKPEDLYMLDATATAWNAPRYHYTKQSIYWLPTPSTSYTVRVVGVYVPADLSADGDTYEAGPGWDEWVVLDVARKIFEKQEKDASELINQRQEVEARIRRQAPDRHEHENMQVRDHRDTFGLGDRALRDLAWKVGF